MVAGIGLLLVFFGTWVGLAARDYGKADKERAERREAESEDDE
jgi:hypothetical protein